MPEKPEDDLKTLLQARERIDQELAQKHRGERAILFTDIVGSTALFERKGDIEGLAFVQRHNALLFPVVEAHAGWIVKTIGDAIMAVFEDAAAALATAATMQQVLRDDRQKHPDAEAIHVRIGVHFGAVMLADDDVFGDAVNTAARIEAKGQADEVLISARIFEQVPAGSVIAEPCGGVPLKGKAEVVPVMALCWGEGAPSVRRFDAALAPARASEGPAGLGITGGARALPPILVLDLMEGGAGLKAAVLEGEQDKGPLRSFAESGWDRAAAEKVLRRFDAFLGGNAASYASKVRAQGEGLWKAALPESVRARLETTERTFLRLQVDEAFADVPWELLHDGRSFLGLRFAVGRVIATRAQAEVHPFPRAQAGAEARRDVALVVSDPGCDLPSAREEGSAVAGLLGEGFGGELRHLQGPVTRADLLGALADVRVMHFAGHVRWREGARGLSVADGVVSASELVAACAASSPSLVFANSCYSAGQGEWRDVAARERGLASSLLLSGVRHYLGPTGPVRDTEALRFALRFWEAMLSGERYGEAVRLAKIRLVESDPKGLAFARYQLYGEPRSALPSVLARRAESATRSTGRTSSSLPAAVLSDFAAPLTPWYRSKWLLAGLGAVLVASLQFWVRHAWRSIEVPAPAEVSALSGAGPGEGAGADPGEAAVAPAAADTALPLPEAVMPAAPIRVVILAFKGLGTDASLGYMAEGLSDTIIADFGQQEGLRLVERSQLDEAIAQIDLSQSKYFDPELRARIGKQTGAEVMVVGSYQQAGPKIRVLSRYVNIETGEILATAKVDGSAKDTFGLQDAFAKEVAKVASVLEAKLR